MLDRALGIVGIALAIIFGVWSLAPDGWPKLPTAIVFAGSTLGVFLVGCAGGMIIGSRRTAVDKRKPSVIETNLFLQFNSSNGIPIEKSPRNIRSWYALFSESVNVDTLDQQGKAFGGFSVPPRWSVFLIFENPPIFRQLIAECRGPNNPQAAVAFVNLEYAIVTITGDVTSATLDISIVR